MKEIDLSIRTSELNKLFKLIWLKKKGCDNKSWKYIFFWQCTCTCDVNLLYSP